MIASKIDRSSLIDRRLLRRTALALLVACGSTLASGAWAAGDDGGPFSPATLGAIDQVVAERGTRSPGYDPTRRPVAVFDWDNTMMKNDLGDATVFWMVRHDLIR